MSPGSVFRSKYKFPYQVIEGGSKILEVISQDDRQLSRNGVLRLNARDVLIQGTFVLSHYFCWVRFIVPGQLRLEGLEMFVCPDDFVSHGLGDSHA